MAKKSRKARLAQRQAEAAKASSTRVAATPQPISTQKPASSVSAPVAQKGSSFVQDYFYVYSDVRFLAVVTILMIIVMLALSFVL